MVTNRFFSDLDVRQEMGNESLRGVETKLLGEEARVMFYILTSCNAKERERNHSVLVSSIPEFM